MHHICKHSQLEHLDIKAQVKKQKTKKGRKQFVIECVQYRLETHGIAHFLYIIKALPSPASVIPKGIFTLASSTCSVRAVNH